MKFCASRLFSLPFCRGTDPVPEPKNGTMLEEGISLPGRPSGRPSGTATGSDAETNPGPGAGAGADAGAGANDDLEPLACVTCRSRKLKCDRSKPACLRCTRLKSDCVYPESRRKPALKRRNVKELEERLGE